MKDTKAPRSTKRSKLLKPRNEPMQGRSRQRAKEIIEVTGELLEEVGLDDLNTVLIAKAVGISVGSLYHYFPNKHAILYAMGTSWLAEVERALDEIATLPIESLPLESLVEEMLALKLRVYRRQKAVLTLVQAMFSVPELRALDSQHDELVISRMTAVFRRMGNRRHVKERERLARLYLEVSHAAFLVVVNQQGERSKRTLADLKLMLCTLLAQHCTGSEIDRPMEVNDAGKR